MDRNYASDWVELSALYEQVDTLDANGLAARLEELRAQDHQLLPSLQRMLAARSQLGQQRFLEELPPLLGRTASPADAPAASPFAASWQAGDRLGGYVLVRRIGVGGMADVWLAHRADGSFHREVALKLLFRHPPAGRRDIFLERFERERDILASLDHPHIARLHDAGVSAGGQPWLALDHVRGETITAWCDRQRLSISERVRLFLQVLLAVEHAHAHLVIHRDLKPSNVLVAEPGIVRLLDFGIAKLLEAPDDHADATDLTVQGGRPLTPKYASPEQLRGAALSTAVDVYALGVLLHELLTGLLPHELDGKTMSEIETIIVNVDPLPPSRRTPTGEALAARCCDDAKALRDLLRPDLDAIVVHCLQKLPAERYESVGAMRLDLQRWLDHEPVQVVLPSAWYRGAKFVRRHRVGVAVAASVFVVVIASVAVTAWQVLRAGRESALASASKEFLLDTLRGSDPENSKEAGAAAGPLLDQGVERAHRLLGNEPELHAEVLERIAEVDQNLDRYVAADRVLTSAMTIYRILDRPEKVARVQLELAFNAWRLGDMVRAERLLADDASRSSLDDLQARRHEIEAWLAWDRGDLKQARAHWTSALALAYKRFGRDDGRTAAILRGVAYTEMSQGDYDAARQHASEEVAIATRAKNVSATQQIDAQADLAQIDVMSGDFAQGMPSTRAALDACVHTLGSPAESCVQLRRQLVVMLIRIGRESEALALLPSFETEATNDLSPSRQLQAKAIILRILAANGLWVRAQVASDALRAAVKHPSLDSKKMEAYLAIAEAAVRHGDGVQAEQLVNEMTAAVGNVPPDFGARALMIRGVAQQVEGKPSVALATLKEATRAYASLYGAEHTNTLLCALNQLAPMVADGKREEAKNLLRRTARGLHSRLPADAPLLDFLSNPDAALVRLGHPVTSNTAHLLFN